MALLEITGVTRTFVSSDVVTRVLGSVSFQIDDGEFVAIMGPSGSGKSTLLHLLGLLDRPTSGTIRFDGQDAGALTDDEVAHLRGERIGFVFQLFHLLERTSVLENVALPLLYASVPRAERLERARRVLDAVGLSHRSVYLPSQLSGGEKQRVAIARALVTNPRIIFADEPTGNLDSASGHTVMELLDRLHAQKKTIVVITHESSTSAYAQRVIQMRDGVIVSDTSQQRHAHVAYVK